MMTQEAQQGPDFWQVKGASTHPPLEEALGGGRALAPGGAAYSRESTGLC